jgi:hypothetical protein
LVSLRSAKGDGCRSLAAFAFRLLPVGHGIHFHRFKFGEIKPEMLWGTLLPNDP